MSEPTTASYLRGILDAIPALIFIVDKDTRITDGNRAAKRFMGAEEQAREGPGRQALPREARACP